MGGLPCPAYVLEIWGGALHQATIRTPAAPTVVKDDGSGAHRCAIVAVGVQGERTAASEPARAVGLATLRWDSIAGADAYVVMRDGKQVAGPLRLEGSQKTWADKPER